MYHVLHKEDYWAGSNNSWRGILIKWWALITNCLISTLVFEGRGWDVCARGREGPLFPLTPQGWEIGTSLHNERERVGPLMSNSMANTTVVSNPNHDATNMMLLTRWPPPPGNSTSGPFLVYKTVRTRAACWILRNITIQHPEMIDPGLMDYLNDQMRDICGNQKPLNLALLLIFLIFTPQTGLERYSQDGQMADDGVGIFWIILIGVSASSVPNY